jgi:16S rRNA (cytidine1402-2'-O)-methyltransferase
MPLYVVATPIGSLSDVTLRALDVLRSADVILCEDTRVTAGLMKAHGIPPRPLVSCHERNEERRAREVLPRLVAGERVALVTNAGTPAVADPGWRVIRAAIDAGVEVQPVPGPCAAVAALVASGLATHMVHFLGWPPRKPGKLRRMLAEEGRSRGSLVFYEAPTRLVRFLAAAREVLGDRRASVSRELTKKFEETKRGTLTALIEAFESVAPRGECTVVIEGA